MDPCNKSKGIRVHNTKYLGGEQSCGSGSGLTLSGSDLWEKSVSRSPLPKKLCPDQTLEKGCVRIQPSKKSVSGSTIPKNPCPDQPYQNSVSRSTPLKICVWMHPSKKFAWIRPTKKFVSGSTLSFTKHS